MSSERNVFQDSDMNAFEKILDVCMNIVLCYVSSVHGLWL